MAIIHRVDKEKDELIEKLLPKKPLTFRYIYPVLILFLLKPLKLALRQELRIYRKMPKETDKFDLQTFDPRNSTTCFMGHGFYTNGQGMLESWTDSNLQKYRRRIGTYPHAKWGNATLLEIWAADHFDKYPEMVKSAYAYGFGKTDKSPKIEFHFLPFFNEAGASSWQKKQVDEDREQYQNDLLDQLVEVKAKKRLEEIESRKHRDDDDE